MLKMKFKRDFGCGLRKAYVLYGLIPPNFELPEDVVFDAADTALYKRCLWDPKSPDPSSYKD